MLSFVSDANTAIQTANAFTLTHSKGKASCEGTRGMKVHMMQNVNICQIKCEDCILTLFTRVFNLQLQKNIHKCADWYLHKARGFNWIILIFFILINVSTLALSKSTQTSEIRDQGEHTENSREQHRRVHAPVSVLLGFCDGGGWFASHWQHWEANHLPPSLDLLRWLTTNY